MRRKKRWDIGRRLDVAEESWGNVPVAELHGDSTLFLSGCRWIVAYRPDFVSVETGLGCVEIAGNGLTLRSFAGDKMAVEGRIGFIRIPERTET